jgi:HicB family
MPRKPMQVVQVNLRIREGLRRKLEAAAKKRGVSLNFEMTDRLARSFEGETFQDLESRVARVAQKLELLAAGINTGPSRLGTPALTVNPESPEAAPGDLKNQESASSQRPSGE